MINKYVFAALVIASFAPLMAQPGQSFIPGYVLVASGDTLRGEILERIDVENTSGIRFRDATGSVTAYNPSDALAYGFDGGRRFVRRELSPGPGAPEEPLFLQVLVSGDVSLFAFSVPTPGHELAVGEHVAFDVDRYAVEREGRVQPLYRTRTRMEHNQIVVDRQYARVLAIAFAGCPAEQQRTARLRFTRRDLIGAVQRYNECVGAPVATAPEAGLTRRSDITPVFSVRVGLGAKNISYHRGHMSMPEPQGLADGSGYSVTVEGLMDTRLDLLHPAVSIPIMLSLSRTAMDSAFLSDVPSWVDEFFGPEDFERFRLGLSGGMRYTLPLPGPSPSVSAGIIIAYLFGEESVARSGMLGRRDFFPVWESGWYAEVGGEAAGLGPLPLLHVALRYETTGIGHPQPMLRTTRSSWITSSVSGVLGFRF